MCVVVAGCVGVYGRPRWQSDGASFAGKRISIDCLDVAVTLTDDRAATAPVVMYTFGNSCWHSVIVDIGAVRAVGQFADGTTTDLHAYDPDHEIASLPLPGRATGKEEIEYVALGDRQPETVCLELGRIDGGTSDHQICVDHQICLGASQRGAP
jgi:hypothetical protein